jgi:aspartyl-tRNA(Asn)/glutamyl-tRNA(Gln) amidotransferase subunit A
MKDLHHLTLVQLAIMIRERQVSPVEVTRAYLDRIERLNPALNAFITVLGDSAMTMAHAAEQEIMAGRYRGPLHGIPIALKDLVETANVRTTAGSRVLENYLPKEDAEVVTRLKRAGAILVGKLNLHEFAYGGSGVISYFGAVTNPWNLGYITGGSSSGSAAAVAAGLCAAAIGTDTAGSIRLPAACCGIVGHKPSYGLVSTAGVIPLSWSYDHVGPMARTVTDAAIVLDVLAGFDARDPVSREYPPCKYAASMNSVSLAGLRVGVARSPFFDELDAEIGAAVEQATKVLAAEGAELQGVGVPALPDRTVATAESFAYHEANYLPAHEAEYQPATLRRIMAGKRCTTVEYILKKRELDLLRRSLAGMLKTVDVVICPTSPILPPAFLDLEQNLDKLRPTELMMLRNTRPFNVLGWPTVSVPCGISKTGLPIGLQIAGPVGRDDLVLRVAYAYEQCTDWHRCRPQL